MHLKYIVASILLLLTDTIWISIIKKHFGIMIGNIQGEKMTINIISVILAYVSLVILYNYFILKDNKGLLDSFLLGLLVYAVYEFTNKAVIKNWSGLIVLFDTLWGGILFTIVTIIIKFMQKKNLL